MPDYCLTELRRLQGHCYAIILWIDENEKEVYLSDIVEAVIHKDHFHLTVRGKEIGLTPFDMTEGKELDKKLYERAKEIALEKSRLYKNLFVDSTERE